MQRRFTAEQTEGFFPRHGDKCVKDVRMANPSALRMFDVFDSFRGACNLPIMNRVGSGVQMVALSASTPDSDPEI
eukprot:COSAG01_NODE_26032_length_725_cov_1.648562_2_plen_74_part_01